MKKIIWKGVPTGSCLLMEKSLVKRQPATESCGKSGGHLVLYEYKDPNCIGGSNEIALLEPTHEGLEI